MYSVRSAPSEKIIFSPGLIPMAFLTSTGIVICPFDVIFALYIHIPFSSPACLTWIRYSLHDSTVSNLRRSGSAMMECVAVLNSEAVVLRTWPVHEADLVVSFFTRDYGRVKGVAKAALKSRKRFGGALEPMTVARAWFAEKPRQELV